MLENTGAHEQRGEQRKDDGPSVEGEKPVFSGCTFDTCFRFSTHFSSVS
jgi:hypothetical protein